MTPFSYKSKRTFSKGEEKIEFETLEGFFMEEAIYWAIGKTPEEEFEQLIVTLKNVEDKDVVRQFPIMGAKGVVKAVENKLVRRNENSMFIITDQEAIKVWKEKWKNL